MAENVTWYDGNTKRTIKIMPDILAELSSESSSVRSVDPQATLVKTKFRGFKVWKLKKYSLLKNVKAGKAPASLKGKSSAVFKDSSGRLRILPGNIIVFFDKSWNKSKVAEWADEKGLSIVKCLSKYNNIYLIKSEPGIKSLQLANSLKGETGIVSASPNWSVEVQAK